MMSILNQKMIQKDDFAFQKLIKNTYRIVRNLLFSNSDLYDRLWQNNTFCYMICTTFWKTNRSKETSEESLQCKMCTLTHARSKNIKNVFANDEPQQKAKLLGKPPPP